jgi:hypothetical protein
MSMAGRSTCRRCCARTSAPALHADNVAEAKRLFAVLRGFVTAHPEAVRGSE